MKLCAGSTVHVVHCTNIYSSQQDLYQIDFALRDSQITVSNYKEGPSLRRIFTTLWLRDKMSTHFCCLPWDTPYSEKCAKSDNKDPRHLILLKIKCLHCNLSMLCWSINLFDRKEIRQVFVCIHPQRTLF